ncbi:MAG: LacI family DNA-binding transcriptional regulator [Blautia sp.]|nr:LacI family DNA-binding transcriptional regulator [Blautia sp.]
MSQKASIKTIAELSGVSVATVSRIINQNGRFSAETEARVRKIMDDLNYYPNTVAKSLRQKHSMVIGIIVPDITNTHFSRLILEIENYLFQYGYSILICNTNEDENLEQRHLDTLISQRVSGILCLTGRRHIIPVNIPVVYLDRRPEGYIEKEDYLVESDNLMGGCLAARSLIESGCRSIGIVYAPTVDINHNMRCEGAAQMITEAGLVPAYIKAQRVSAPIATDAVMDYFKNNPSPDGLVCTNDLLAVGAFLALMELGISVPGKVKITGYDDSPLAGVYSPSLTSIHQDAKAMSKCAADMILKMIDGLPPAKSHEIIPVRLISRETTA